MGQEVQLLGEDLVRITGAMCLMGLPGRQTAALIEARGNRIDRLNMDNRAELDAIVNCPAS